MLIIFVLKNSNLIDNPTNIKSTPQHAKQGVKRICCVEPAEGKQTKKQKTNCFTIKQMFERVNNTK